VSVGAPFGGDVLIADTSVWLRADRLPEPIKAEWQLGVAGGQIATSPAVVMELLYRTRENPAQQEQWRQRLTAPRNLIPDRTVWGLAERAYIELAQQHALQGKSLTDVLVAATATRYRFGVLHFDAHFDALAGLQCLDFESRWVADRHSDPTAGPTPPGPSAPAPPS
jgi:predicted nucleic acid-binding protein